MRVSVLLFPVVDDGLKLAVTPAGSPLALKATLLVNPPVRVIVIELVPLAPRLIVKLEGFRASEKSGAELTTRPITVDRVNPPPAPVTLIMVVPAGALVDALSVSVVLFALVEEGLKLAVTPVGSPLALKATLPVKPPLRVMLIVVVTLAPRLTFTLAGLAESVKSGPDPTGGKGPRRKGARKLCLLLSTVVQSSLSMPPVSPELGFKVQKVKPIPVTP